MAKWSKPIKIEVIGHKKDKIVEARCKGIFAIHDSLDNPKYKTLTHIPTGYAIIKLSTTGRIYKAVKELESLDWTGVTHDVVPKTFDMAKYRAIQFQYSL